MEIFARKTKNGMSIRFNRKNYKLIFPEKIWKKYPLKDFLVDNLSYLLTINLPLVAEIDELNYNTSIPFFKIFFDNMVIRGIPHAVEEYKNLNTQEILKKFMNIQYKFKDYNYKIPNHNYKNTKNRAVVSFSAGKDSTLSLAIANEIGLNPIPVYINDTVSPTENLLKKKTIKKISDDFNLSYHIIKNEIEKLNDFETWNMPESCIGYTHMLTSFCFILLPIAFYYNSKYIVVGNEFNLNYKIMNKDGYLTFPSFDQSKEWMIQQNLMINLITNNKTSIISLIEPLTNLSIYKILFERYPEYAKNLASCYGLDASNESRWCHNCSTCASSYLMISAFEDPKKVGFKYNMFDKKYKKLYSVFGGGDIYEKSEESIEENKFAFYLAYKNGAKGYLINKFKKKFLKEVISREDDLYKKFFSLHKTVSIPKNIKKKVFGIYSEALKY
ncbi:MAG: hypothetical protein J7K26_01120 [Candidatus Aenigmarchaeota archaeon]|nr:hypothetical protein [Candidatus Aenigmarchaeota archaeon]